MSYERVPYAEASTPAEMTTDCRAVGRTLRVPNQLRRIARTALGVVPGTLKEPPAPVRRAGVAVSDAAARFAGRLFD